MLGKRGQRRKVLVPFGNSVSGHLLSIAMMALLATFFRLQFF